MKNEDEGSRFGQKALMHNCTLTGEQGRLNQFIIPFDIELLGLLVDHGFDKSQKIARI